MLTGVAGGDAGGLKRTASKLETESKANKLRLALQKERPIPMGQAAKGMPNEMEDQGRRNDFYFYRDDGGFRATDKDDEPGGEIYYLGIIDCLTHVSWRVFFF